MVDIHSHIIYDIDDGSKDRQMTIQMLKTAVDTGTKKIIATPHYYRGRFMESIDIVKRRVNELKAIARENEIEIDIYSGQEVYFTGSLLDDLSEGVIGTLNDSRYMLIEFNMAELDEEIFDVLYELKIKGIVPIIAHPERYKVFIDDITRINEFIDEGCLFQLNVSSINGLLGKDAKKVAEILLENNIYSFMASDAHSDGRRDTDMKKYKDLIEKINPDFIEKSSINGEKLINNEEIIFCGNRIQKKKKGLLSFFKR